MPSGTNTTRIATVHAIESRYGCSLGNEPDGNGLGFPNSWRVACVSALIGFHSAIGWSTSGSVAVGTKAFERKVSGKMIRKPSCCTVSDVVYNAGILVVLMLSGLVVGWRVHGTVAEFFLAVALMLFFTFAMAWIGVLIGLTVPSVEVGQQLGFLIVFPLTFVSNAFVPTETLPEWLQPIAIWNPFSALVAATRELFGNPNPFTSGFPGEHSILLSILWTVGLLVVFAPLAVRKYRSIDR